ncbi:acetoacetyl-CoA reductase [Phenylobacterium hankyongense]|uniref:Acetoacetyl-CoA reductase n=1 Tax=Phenylobacterium hankyongense TaxID=1813876 RepID=A0A328B346_9CAUL|nr:SDR family NAD(P)-dependent oxidoreductase [Phenylobacterium hankyongense]RAK60851.1 acetoacetyl-CoA reductase [Phenylobacterium hankyongense]
MSGQPRRIVILGATSAMAEATARLYAAEGAALVLVGRRLDRLEEIRADLLARGASAAEAVAADLARPDAAADQLAAWAGPQGADAVLLFYGVLGDQAQAERDPAIAREILSVNFTSAAEWCLAAANLLEAQRRGALVVIGSVAGDRGRQSNYVYGAAKAGLGVLVQGIAHRLALRNTGARAVLVKPGFVDTPMTDGLPKGGPLWAKPEAIARIVRASAQGGGPVVYAPWFWRFIMLIIRLVPAPLFHKRPL